MGGWEDAKERDGVHDHPREKKGGGTRLDAFGHVVEVLEVATLGGDWWDRWVGGWVGGWRGGRGWICAVNELLLWVDQMLHFIGWWVGGWVGREEERLTGCFVYVHAHLLGHKMKSLHGARCGVRRLLTHIRTQPTKESGKDSSLFGLGGWVGGWVG